MRRICYTTILSNYTYWKLEKSSGFLRTSMSNPMIRQSDTVPTATAYLRDGEGGACACEPRACAHCAFVREGGESSTATVACRCRHPLRGAASTARHAGNGYMLTRCGAPPPPPRWRRQWR